jgi:hypothetical protein
MILVAFHLHRQRTSWVESRKGAVSVAIATGPFPFPAHQTGRAYFGHPAFRQISPAAHGRLAQYTSLRRNTPNFPNTMLSENLAVPGEDTLWRRFMKCLTLP